MDTLDKLDKLRLLITKNLDHVNDLMQYVHSGNKLTLEQITKLNDMFKRHNLDISILSDLNKPLPNINPRTQPKAQRESVKKWINNFRQNILDDLQK